MYQKKLSFYTNTKDRIDKLMHSYMYISFVVLGVLKVILVKRKEPSLKE